MRERERERERERGGGGRGGMEKMLFEDLRFVFMMVIVKFRFKK